MSNGSDFDIDCKQEEWEKQQMREAGLDDGEADRRCHICGNLDELKECHECHGLTCPEHQCGDGCCSECTDSSEE